MMAVSHCHDIYTMVSTDNSTAVHCPSCERYIGPAATTCPYCDCDARPQPLLRALRIIAVLLALLGLLWLFLAARQREMAFIRISDISPVMNFATVRVTGTVVREPYIAEEDGRVDYASFLVSDGSGDLRVAARQSVAQQLCDADCVPPKGSRVVVTGILDVSGSGKTRLRLRAVTDIQRVDRVPLDSAASLDPGEGSAG